jgi:radical SAM protein with 4Fe4S-binding SPASM domain
VLRSAYGEFSSALHKESVDHRIPLIGAIEITRRCPLQCCHCYNNLPLADHDARREELTYVEHCRLLDEITASGCLWLLYTGGEIFARNDFLDIYAYAKRKGLLITLFTNATLITPDIADYLAQWVPFAVEISLYGCTQATYESITGVPGSFERCMRGIGLLRDRHIPMSLKSAALTLNKHELGEMRRFVEHELELEYKFDGMMSPGIDCNQNPLSVRLTPEEIVELDLADPKRLAAWQEFGRLFHGPVQSPKDRDKLYYCGAGINSFAIDPLGRMSMCVLSHADTYDLRTGSFRDGWDRFLYRIRHRMISRSTKCLQCEIKAICGMCPASAELEQGDPESPVDFLCRVAHLRAQALGFPIPAHGQCEYCGSGQTLISARRNS